jgi:N4-gp56 family major capsid protein
VTLTLAAVTALNPSFIERECLERAKPNLVHTMFGKSIKLPTRNSTQWKVARWERISPTNGSTAGAIKSIIEGTVPTETTPTRSTVTINTAQYGNLFVVSDMVAKTSLEDVTKELIEVNAENLAQSQDAIYRDGLTGGTTVFRLTDDYGGVSGAARVNVIGRMNASALDKMATRLKRQLAMPITKQITAGGKVSTQGVMEGYVMIVHPDVEHDIRDIPGFIPVTEYASSGGLYKGEFGAYRDFRFVRSTHARYFLAEGAAVAGTRGNTNSDVYACLVFGQDAYATIELQDSVDVSYLPYTQKDHNNPLGQWAQIGWKGNWGSGILNEEWMGRIECAASAE